MSFALNSLSVSFLLLLCFILLLQLSADGFNGAEITSSLKENSNRKLSVVEGFEAVFMIDGKSKKKGEYKEGWELRAAPLGPDPLHHHGANPKKPRTP